MSYFLQNLSVIFIFENKSLVTYITYLLMKLMIKLGVCETRTPSKQGGREYRSTLEATRGSEGTIISDYHNSTHVISVTLTTAQKKSTTNSMCI